MCEKLTSAFVLERGMLADDFTHIEGVFASHDLAVAHIRQYKDMLHEEWLSWKDTEDAKAQVKHGVYGYDGTFETWWRYKDEVFSIEEFEIVYQIDGQG